MYFQTSVYFGKCIFRQVFILADMEFQTIAFILADVIQTNVHSDRCNFRQVFILEKERPGKCFSGKCFSGNVFLRGVRIVVENAPLLVGDKNKKAELLLLKKFSISI